MIFPYRRNYMPNSRKMFLVCRFFKCYNLHSIIKSLLMLIHIIRNRIEIKYCDRIFSLGQITRYKIHYFFNAPITYTICDKRNVHENIKFILSNL